ncbi:MAG TPA: hypothetical protein VKA60_16130 [Blastocatellia bacterium]|nr:hypothetical protein [Blastocatellia bacterium]
MRIRLMILFAICLLAAFASQALAQTPQPPPKVLTIFREDVKPGRGAAHEKVETSYAAAMRKAKWNTYSLALSSVSGVGDAWFLTGYPSLEAIETDHRNIEKNTALVNEYDRLDEMDSQFRTNQRMMIAVLQDNLSYQSSVDIPHMRYFDVITFRVRPGHEAQFAEAAKLIRDAYEKAKTPNVHWATYAVMSGAPSGTYLVFIPMKSLKEVDANMEAEKDFVMALGEGGGKKLEKIASEAYISMESSIYAFSPRMSYVPKEWEDADTAFWKPKAMTVAKAPMKKAPAKTASAKTSAETKQ